MHCNIYHEFDWQTNEKRVYDAHRALIELCHTADLLIHPANEEMGPTLREVKDFNSLLEKRFFFKSDYPSKLGLKLRLKALLEKGIDPTELREILFWDVTEFRAVILNALHARGENLFPDDPQPKHRDGDQDTD
ncbi:MAG: hypothetical protein FJ123_00220 [Deltaproteobacteria bacterium]|nr:hypothetical protein [Deltaproteobacteria bacterium]